VFEPPHPAGTDVRLYFGQGLSHGITAEIFTDLAVEFAEISRQDIKYLVVRDTYGFADVAEMHARTLIDNLNGIEYNGALLPVECATILEPPRTSAGRDQYSDRRGGGRYQQRQGNYRRDDRRRGGGGGRGGRGRDYRR
jgi:hypothetical protein